MRRLILPAVAVLLSAVGGCDQRTSSPLGPRDASARLSALERASASRFKVSASLYRPSPAESTLIERWVKNFPPEDRDQLRAAFIPRGPALLVGIQFTNNPTAQALADSIFALRSRDAQARLNAHGLQRRLLSGCALRLATVAQRSRIHRVGYRHARDRYRC